MPRSKNKEIYDLLERIKGDEELRHRFAQLIMEIIRTDFSANRDFSRMVMNAVSEELERRLYR